MEKIDLRVTDDREILLGIPEHIAKRTGQRQAIYRLTSLELAQLLQLGISAEWLLTNKGE